MVNRRLPKGSSVIWRYAVLPEHGIWCFRIWSVNSIMNNGLIHSVRPLSLLRSWKSQYSLLEGSSSPWLKQLLPPPRSNLLTRLFAPSRWSFSGFFRQAAIKHQSQILEAYAVDITFTLLPVLVSCNFDLDFVQSLQISKLRLENAHSSSTIAHGY